MEKKRKKLSIIVTIMLATIVVWGITLNKSMNIYHEEKVVQKNKDIEFDENKFSDNINDVFEEKYKTILNKYSFLEEKVDNYSMTIKTEDVFKNYSDLLSNYLKHFSITYYKNEKDLLNKQMSCKNISKTIFIKKDKTEFVVPIILDDKKLTDIIEKNLKPLKNNHASLRERVNMNEIRAMILIKNQFDIIILANSNVKGFSHCSFNLDGDKYDKAYQILESTGLTLTDYKFLENTKQEKSNFQFK